MEGLKIVWPDPSNQIFLTMPKKIADQLHDAGADFHKWSTEALPKGFVLEDIEILVRLVTSFETRDKDRVEFCNLVIGSVKNL
jgi:threonine aldolase